MSYDLPKHVCYLISQGDTGQALNTQTILDVASLGAGFFAVLLDVVGVYEANTCARTDHLDFDRGVHVQILPSQSLPGRDIEVDSELRISLFQRTFSPALPLKRRKLPSLGSNGSSGLSPSEQTTILPTLDQSLVVTGPALVRRESDAYRLTD